jgi:parallel beta-helix repeat protein
VDKVKSGKPSTIIITGVCDETNVTITKDDITLIGNEIGAPCDKEAPGGVGTINGTITVDGVRARIEHLTITGSGDGVNIRNRAAVHLFCNDISNNEGTGVIVVRSSNAVLRDNTLSGNGTRGATPSIFFDCGLFAADASSVDSRGNTYTNNRYCAIEIDRQSTFRNGPFLPRDPDNPHPADPTERDTFTELGCTPATGAGCLTTDEGPVAIEVFNGGLVDLRNADVNGEIESIALSSFRVGGDAVVQGNILNRFGSVVRIRDRSSLGDRSVTYTGTLICNDTSQTFFSSVQCGQTCSGPIPGSCIP